MTKNNIEAIGKLTEMGWKLDQSDETAWIDLEGGFAGFTTGDPGDITGTDFQVDLKTGAYRVRGYGEGCFWSDWEGGHPVDDDYYDDDDDEVDC